MEHTLKEIIDKPSQLARALGVGRTTVSYWIKLNAIPPRRILAVAGALDRPVVDLLPFTRKDTLPVKTIKKTLADLEALERAHAGLPYESRLPEASIKVTLAKWGERLPLLCQTLRRLHQNEINCTEAAQILGVAPKTVANLRMRYGIAPGKRKAEKKPLGHYKATAKIAAPLVLDVIAGRKSVLGASRESGVPLRTLHRHVERALRPQTVSEISHWSPSFRLALAWEIDRNQPRVSVNWRKWAENRKLLLKKKTNWPKAPQDWRKAPLRRLLVAYLTDERGLEALAASRGGDPSVLKGLFDRELAQMGMNPLALSVHHQAAVAEILLAMESHFRAEAPT